MKRITIKLIAITTLGASLVAFPIQPAVAQLRITPLRIIGGPGHAGLYGWGAATMNDGSVLIGDYWNYQIMHYAKDGAFLGYLVTGQNQGAGYGQHLSPYGIAVDPVTNDVYFGDVDGNRSIDKYDQNGNFLLQFGSNGSGPNKYKYPSYLAIASDRNVYICDQWDHNIVITDPNGNEIKQFGSPGTGNGQFKQPRGIGLDANDNVYVADNYNTRVEVFDKTGKFLNKFGSAGSALGQFSPGADLRGLAVDKLNGWVYVVDAASGYVDKFDLQGNFLLRFGGFGSGDGQFIGGGRGVTVDGDGNVWVGDMPGFRAQKFDSNGSFLLAVPNPAQPPPNGGFAQPRGVAVDTNGNIFVTDTNNWRVQKFAPDGSFVTAWGHRGGSTDGFNYERGISVDPTDNSVVVADTDNHLIKKYSNDGNLIWSVGGFGTAPGQFQNPHGVDVGPDGRIYVADTQNARVQVLDPSDGHPLYSFGSKGSSNGQFQFPRAINVDPIDGTIWVADSIRGIVQHFTNSGVYIGQFGSFGSADAQFLKCSGIVTDANYVYVADADANRVKVWTKSGTFVMAFGVGGRALGGLIKPHGLFLTPDGHLYVVEQSGERVQEFLIQDLVPDTSPPDTAIVAPTINQTLYATPISLSGTATDDVGVTAVKLSIQDRDTLQYWHSDGSWGTFQQFYATVNNPGSTNATWSYSWTPTGSPLHFTLQAQAFDAWGNPDPTRASRSFNRSLTPPDTVPPDTVITSPSGIPTFTFAPIPMSGTATDNVGVTAVKLSIKDRNTNLYWHTDGSWGTTFQQFDATVSSPGSTSSTWSYSWTPTGTGTHFVVLAEARDAAGNKDPTRAVANFNYTG